MIKYLIAASVLIGGIVCAAPVACMFEPTLLPTAQMHGQVHARVVSTANAAPARHATPQASPEAAPSEHADGVAVDGAGTIQVDVPIAVADPVDVDPSNPAHTLLGSLERNADGLTGFTADVHYVTVDDLLGDTVIRKGRLVYELNGAARRFAILFDTRIADGRKRTHEKHYVFSGRWLVEIDHAEKLFTKREIAAPGEQFDPFRLGEGPIPLPIGQSRADVLRMFEASLVPRPDSGPLKRLADTPLDGIRLEPKADTSAAEEYQRIDLFYDRATALPVGIDLIEINGDRKTVRLENLRRNPELGPSDLEALRIEDPNPREWHISIHPFKRR